MVLRITPFTFIVKAICENKMTSAGTWIKNSLRNNWLALPLVLVPLLCGLFVYCFVHPIRFEYFLIKGSPEVIVAPDWIRKWVPDFFWAFALGNSILLVWRKSPQDNALPYLIVCFLFSCIFEFLQYSNILKGTFDPFDILTYLIGFLLSILINSKLP